MGELRAWALPVTELRGMFGAMPELAPRLRMIASDHFRVPVAENRPRPTWRQAFAPLLRTPPDAPRVPHGMPLTSDVEDLLAGRFVLPERLPQAWTVLTAWLDDFSWGRCTIDLPGSRLADWEFDLARAGLACAHAPSRLLAREAQLPIRPLPGTRIGYVRHDHVLATAAALHDCLDQLEGASRDGTSDLLDLLDRFPEWADKAEQAGRERPDLFCVLSASEDGSPLVGDVHHQA